MYLPQPGLTDANRVKQVSFAKRVHDRWGLPPHHTKILWCMSDEKWWFGLVARTFAKMCPELGVEKKSFSAHHKSQKRKGNPVKHKLGDVVLVDCNVKGIDIGTPTDPKFALRTLWEEIILLAYDALTAVGGPGEGAVIVQQEDNAPPHQEGDFHA
jgi:hypothetical protein